MACKDGGGERERLLPKRKRFWGKYSRKLKNKRVGMWPAMCGKIFSRKKKKCVVKDLGEKKKKKSNFLMAVPHGHTFTPFSPFFGEWESGLLP